MLFTSSSVVLGAGEQYCGSGRGFVRNSATTIGAGSGKQKAQACQGNQNDNREGVLFLKT
jgi:hypothetical protein